MKPKASVCLITYNHEKYLQQCLDSIIAQQCSFAFEVVIGEDCSTDDTPTIIKKYKEKYPELIRVISASKNVGMVENWRRTLSACCGEYIAITEGDDYWSSSLKLQKQIDLMDTHQEYALSFHDVDVIFSDNVSKLDPLARFKEQHEFTIQDVITKNWFIPTCSMVVRKSMLEDFPSWTQKLKAIDIVVQLLAATKGSIGYVDEKLGMYRIHQAGQSQVQWSGKENAFHLTTIDILKNFDTHTNGKYRFYVKQRLHILFQSLMYANSPKSKYYLKAMFELVRLNPSQNISILKDWLITNLIPKSLYKAYRSIKE